MSDRRAREAAYAAAPARVHMGYGRPQHAPYPRPPRLALHNTLSCPHNKLTPAINQYPKRTGAAGLQNIKHLQAFLCLFDLHAVGLNQGGLSIYKCGCLAGSSSQF